MLIPLRDEDSHRHAAQDLETERPGWIVLWGVYSRQYWAYPLFDVPPRTILHSTDPRALAAKMTQVELSVRVGQRPAGGAPGQHPHDRSEPSGR